MKMINKRLGVCTGCNGYGAKGSDEIGRLAAEMMLVSPAIATAQ
jgi:hypothetical protein